MGKQKIDLQIKKDEIRKQILEKRNNLSIEEKKWINYKKFISISKKCSKYNDFYGYEKWS